MERLFHWPFVVISITKMLFAFFRALRGLLRIFFAVLCAPASLRENCCCSCLFVAIYRQAVLHPGIIAVFSSWNPPSP
jgi:hypothetical protein